MTEEKNVLSIFQRPKCSTSLLQSKDVSKTYEKMITRQDSPISAIRYCLYEGEDGHSSYCYRSSNPSSSGDLITCSFARTESMAAVSPIPWLPERQQPMQRAGRLEFSMGGDDLSLASLHFLSVCC